MWFKNKASPHRSARCGRRKRKTPAGRPGLFVFQYEADVLCWVGVAGPFLSSVRVSAVEKK